ncbi:MAG: HAD hydrolase family protein [Rhodospirillales bacterium]|jgi:3-deoxy-D-manno-octulosonate 8-phosphate phosphatase (KDO 8-P phosphatase)|nr:HAD hydrolase family protein [Rhodospirillales bacterium]
MVQKRVSRFELSNRLRDIKLLSLDVDGILTDGGLYFADDGNTFRKFNVKDGLGLKRVMQAGVVVAIISAGKQDAIQRRMESLGISHIFTNVEDKFETLVQVCDELGIDRSQVIHMGDDLNDLPILEAVGCPISVPDAMPDVRDAAIYVTTEKGGEGAVREVCDMLIVARG